MTDDPRVAAARYRQDRLETSGPQAGSPDGGPPGTESTDAAAPASPAAAPSAMDRAAAVEVEIQQAIRRGEFDDLPGAGKPIPGLGSHHDPDWWIRRKIEREQLNGLGPPALMLRVEAAELDERLDALTREAEVRDALEDFNRRVVEARRQLLGGPPVVTPVRDVESEVAAWRRRRDASVGSEEEPAPPSAPRPRWWRRHAPETKRG